MMLVLVSIAACSDNSSERIYTLDELPVREWTLGLPVSGDGKLTVSKSLLAVDDWSKAKGHARFNCDGCTLGDGHTPMQLEGLGELPISFLTFDEVVAVADFADGRVHLTTRLRSAEFELDASVDATLARTAAASRVEGCVNFRPTNLLAERDPKLHALISTTGAEHDNDGWYMIAIEGRVGELKRRARPCHPVRTK